METKDVIIFYEKDDGFDLQQYIAHIMSPYEARQHSPCSKWKKYSIVEDPFRYTAFHMPEMEVLAIRPASWENIAKGVHDVIIPDGFWVTPADLWNFYPRYPSLLNVWSSVLEEVDAQLPSELLGVQEHYEKVPDTPLHRLKFKSVYDNVPSQIVHPLLAQISWETDFRKYFNYKKGVYCAFVTITV